MAQIIYVRLHPSPEELYERERNAFRALPPEVRAQYSGRWVAVHNGNVVASGISDTEAARQFLREFGDTHVFVGYIGEEPPAYQISPRR
ncbi:MAG: hypothetical protein HYU41_16900 [Candidatus Rokubacteria bacterium]|nr:hypothetical protein [Candidatus Rokubacteria bacterium]